MPGEKDSSVDVSEVKTPVVETDTTGEVKTEEAKGLSRRDALEVAIEAHKEPKKDGDVSGVAPNNKGNIGDKPNGGRGKEAGKGVQTPIHAEPPSQWNEEEKADFHSSSPKQQEATLRLYNSRLRNNEEIRLGKESLVREREQIAQEKAELQWSRDIAKQVEPFLKARPGNKKPVHEQILHALDIVNSIDSDTLGSVNKILKAKGIELPKEFLEAANKTGSIPSADLAPLQNDLNAVKNELAQAKAEKNMAFWGQNFASFMGAKNAGGTSKFPSADNSEEGIKLSANIGTLVMGTHPDSTGFFAYVKARTPGALNDPSRLLEQAYTWFGGRVDESPAAKPQDTQNHIQKSKRAASSVPGRTAQSVSGPVKRYKTYREAAQAALAEAREREGD